MEINEVFKQLRTERNISQRDLVKYISNRSTLNSFENNGSRISYEILSQYLDKLNVKLNEFDAMLQPSAKKSISHKLYNAFYKQDLNTIEELMPEALALYEETKDFFYFNLYAQSLYAVEIQYKKMPLEEFKLKYNDVIHQVHTYLFSIETWNEFEHAILINNLWIFSIEHNKLFHRKISNDTALMHNDQRRTAKLFINLCIFFIENEEYASAQQITEQLETLVSYENIHISLVNKLLKSIVKKKLSPDNIDVTEECLHVINTYKTFSCESYGQQLEDWVKKLEVI